MANNNRKERLKNTNPFNLPGSVPSLDELTDSMLADDSINMNKDIIHVSDDGTITYQRVNLTEVGLQVPDDIVLEEWLAIGNHLQTYDNAIQWMLGDWVVAGLDHAVTWDLVDTNATDDESKYAPLMELTQYSYSSLSKFAYAARGIPIFRRRKNVSFSLHMEILQKFGSQKEQDKWLQRASEENLSVRGFRDLLKPALETSSSLNNGLFDQTRKPKVSQLQKLWTRAREGDEQAMGQLKNEIRSTREWLDDIESSLDD